MRLGILGGTFNPPHLGHLVCAQEALVALELDRVLFVPAGIPAHKQVPEDPGPRQRLELCRAAVVNDERFEASDLEVRRPGTSYTVDTLGELQVHAPDNDLFFILGADAAAGLGDWRDPERLLSLARLAVARRPGTRDSEAKAAVIGLGAVQERVRFFDMPQIGISSTMIRTRAHAGQPIRYLVPPGVASYIEENGLYTPGQRGTASP